GRSGISHVGVALGRQEFIHASSSQGVMISSLNEKYWAERLVGARRIIE
ncbi:MAG: C40 family peptidase, partial [candidate division Zixibacteria bacterium]|nr:C40 family peptidase [candidate division Zixibacteria bacterium]